jgi:hypothetical protein
VDHSLQVMNFSTNNFQLFVVVRGQGAIPLFLEVSDLDLELGLVEALHLVVDTLLNS